MTSNDFSDFVVPDEKSSLPDGEYVAQVDNMQCIVSEYGKFYTVDWRVLRPSEFEGAIHQERYNINHESPKARNFAIHNFGNFCREIGSLSKGDVPTEKNFLFKVANILIRNKPGKDGRVFANVVRHTLVDQQASAVSAPVNIAYDAALAQATAAQYGVISTPGVGIQPSSEPLNDEVPF
jgi:hypothetical protein